MRPTASLRAMYRSFLSPSIRSRRLFTSSFFMATFCGAVITVGLSASSILPCPARVRRDQYRREVSLEEPVDCVMEERLDGERVKLTRKGGWIEIEERRPRLP